MKSVSIIIFAIFLIVLLSGTTAAVIPTEDTTLEAVQRDINQIHLNSIENERKKRCTQGAGCRMPGHPNSPYPFPRHRRPSF